MIVDCIRRIRSFVSLGPPRATPYTLVSKDMFRVAVPTIITPATVFCISNNYVVGVDLSEEFQAKQPCRVLAVRELSKYLSGT